MSFSAFILFFCVVLWLSFGAKWVLSVISAKKNMNPFYKAVFSFRYALLFVISNLGIELVVILYQYL